MCLTPWLALGMMTRRGNIHVKFLDEDDVAGDVAIPDEVRGKVATQDTAHGRV